MPGGVLSVMASSKLIISGLFTVTHTRRNEALLGPYEPSQVHMPSFFNPSGILASPLHHMMEMYDTDRHVSSMEGTWVDCIEEKLTPVV